MTVRQLRIEAVPAPATPITAPHIRRRSGFIDEHKLIGIEFGLILSPAGASGGDVRPVLLGCEHGFF
jgi:hypothetical protein